MMNTIAISGASRGIGYAIAEIFGQLGWTIFIAARKKNGLEQMQKDWQKKYPKSKLHTTVADLSSQEGCELFASAIKKQSPHLHILVNNVGQFAPGRLLDGTTDQLAYFLQTNVLSAHYLTRSLSVLLCNTPQAHFFTIGSIAADDWPPEMAAYALSKECLHAWHRGMRRELAAKNVDATLIIPGATYTSSWDGIDVDPNELLSPEVVAQLIWRNWKNDVTDKEVCIVK